MPRRFLAIAAAILSHVVSCYAARGATFQSQWPDKTQRTWIGPDYFANRLEDWQLRDGCVECIETARKLPVRSLHLLTYSIGPEAGSFKTTVVIDAPFDEAEGSPDSWGGFLIGAGGEQVDYRITAMVHHRPAEDGGLLAVVDNHGRVALRDFTAGSEQDASWYVRGPLKDEDAPKMPATVSSEPGPGAAVGGPIRLRLLAQSVDGAYRLTLASHNADTGRLLAEATYDGVSPDLIDGCLALVSHLGPEGTTHGYRFRDWSASGDKIIHHPERAFGPVLCAQYTLSRGVLKLTAQMGPLGPDDEQSAQLQIQDETGQWRSIAESSIIDDSFTFPFRVENWDGSRDTPYRISYRVRTGPAGSAPFYYRGTIRAIPNDKDEFTLAAFACAKCITGKLRWNDQAIWFPHQEVVDAVMHHDPDLLYFSGDQIYEGDLTPITWSPDERVIRDYLYKWYRWCWSFRDLARDRPCICVPDDHDVYHGNLWGAGGVMAPPDPRYFNIQDRGGYKMSTRFVNAVHRTQVSHLPDPPDPEPLPNGVTVFHTRLEYAGMSFAILADRMFKSAPAVVMPDAGVENGWFQKNPDFDPPTQADVPGAKLLGERQLALLDEWAADWSDGAWMKVVLSQTPFSNVATIPEYAKSGSVISMLPNLPPDEYPEDHKHAADCDSNGWPQSGRNRAIDAMRRCFALHVAGDQHLASTIQYGIEDWRDGGYALTVPAVGNTWPRRWFPPEPGANHDPDMPRYTGDYLDGFGNRMTVYAVANPHITGHEPAALYDRVPGYGIVRFERASRKITIEVWPRWEDPSRPDAEQYPGWPIVIHQNDNYARQPVGYLPEIRVHGMTDPVVQVINETTGEIVYTVRIAGQTFLPPVFSMAYHTIRVGVPDSDDIRSYKSVHPISDPRLDSRRFEPHFE